MIGTWEKSNSSWTITLRSTGYAGDGRVVASTRRVKLADDELSYQMRMMTTATNDVSLHLKAQLTRQTD